MRVSCKASGSRKPAGRIKAMSIRYAGSGLCAAGTDAPMHAFDTRRAASTDYSRTSQLAGKQEVSFGT
jgi:hypothetical protein